MKDETLGVLPGAGLFCPECGYDLRGSGGGAGGASGGACPECGAAVDRARLRASAIPWVNRAAVGRRRAFWRTVWAVTLRPGEFGREVVREVDLGEALRFRRAVVGRTMGWLAVLAVVTLAVASAAGWWSLEDTPGVVIAGWGAAAVLLAVYLYLATGLQSYWFHPRGLPVERQNRAVALSYYAAGPVALLPSVVALGLGAAVLAALGDAWRVEALTTAGAIGVIASVGLAVGIPVVVTRVSWALARRAALREGWSLAAMWVALPAAWVALAVVVFGVLPGAAAMVWVMVRTWP